MKAISLFSGCGGDTFGMIQAGVDVVAYNELVDIFCQTHDLNMPNCLRIGKDIQKTTKDDWKPYKNIDLVIGGIPCQSFSNGGKKDPNDPRGKLYLDFMNVLKIVQPKYAIIENVKGLTTRKDSNGEKFFDKIIKEFQDLGYTNIKHKVFQCQKYGVPQKRERLIILATKGIDISFPEESPKLTLKNIVSFNMKGAFQVSDVQFKNIPDECILTDMNNDETETEFHPFAKSPSVNGFSFGKRDSPRHCEIVDIREPTKTIICSYKFQPRLYVPLKNKNGCFLRPFTIDELKMIQGFPKDYKMAGTLEQQITQLGNAIPPPLIKKIIDQIYKFNK